MRIKTTPQQPIVLFNIGWMRDYAGSTTTDRLVNGGGWIEAHESDPANQGNEQWNFLAVKAMCYGFVQSKGNRLNLGRVGGEPGSVVCDAFEMDESDCLAKRRRAWDFVDGVTVVFASTPPDGGRVVVGWYMSARLWADRHWLHRPGNPRGILNSYYAEARRSDCILLPPRKRTLSVPDARRDAWGMGQSNVRYTDQGGASPYLKKLRAFMLNIDRA